VIALLIDDHEFLVAGDRQPTDPTLVLAQDGSTSTMQAGGDLVTEAAA